MKWVLFWREPMSCRPVGDFTRSIHNAEEARTSICVPRYRRHFGMAAGIHAESVEGDSPKEMIWEDLIAERIAIESGMRGAPASRASPRGTYPKAAQRLTARGDVRSRCS